MSYLILIVLGIVLVLLVVRKPKCGSARVSINKRNMKARKLMVVAHPDDELLWGYRYLISDPKSWKVICVCCASDTARVKEFETVLATIGVDNYEMWDNENTIIGWRLHPTIVNRLQSEVVKYDIVITHNWYGEYGNLQHMAVHRAVSAVRSDVNVFSQQRSNPKGLSKDELVSVSYPSQRWIIRVLQPFHSKY